MELSFFNIIWGLVIFVFFYNLTLLLFTVIENRKKLYCLDKKKTNLYPTVCIFLPFLNEEKTLAKSLNSLINLDYPRDKLEILAIDDGSTDNSRNIVEEFMKKNSFIKILYHKKNKGKYVALNNGIKNTAAEVIGCLDADSTVDPSSLKKMVHYFQDERVAGVAAGPKINNPKTLFQHIIQAEFLLEILMKKYLSLFDSLIIIPGPYSFFRKKAIDEVGGFKEAHKTEDIEITMRLQKHHFKLKSALDVSVYTIGRNTFKKLYKQRLRWGTGFFKNLWDYKVLFSKKTYGDLSVLLLLSVLSIFFMLVLLSYSFFALILNGIIGLQKMAMISFNFTPILSFDFNLLFLSISPLLFLNLIIIFFVIGIIFLSSKLSFEKQSFAKGVLLFIFIYPWLVWIFIISSFYSIIFNKKITWK